jgi:hypothetical protein
MASTQKLHNIVVDKTQWAGLTYKNNMQVRLYKRKTPLSRDISCAGGVFQLLDKSSLDPKTIQSYP